MVGCPPSGGRAPPARGRRAPRGEGVEKSFCEMAGFPLSGGGAWGPLAPWRDAARAAFFPAPPYSSGGVTLGARQADPAQKYQQSGTKRRYPPMLSDAKDQRSWTMWCMLWLAECWRIARDGAPLMAFTDWRQLPA